MAINKAGKNVFQVVFTKASFPKEAGLYERKNVSIAIVNEGDKNCLMRAGTAGLVNDKVRMKEWWSTLMNASFSLGLKTPEMAFVEGTHC